MPDPTLDDLRNFCDNQFGPLEPDDEYDFNREEAIYWFATHNHSGQDSNLYKALCESKFSPGILAHPSSILAMQIYSTLSTAF